ncbi:MAG: T9SS type A sorting domain-containing protein [Bacteroidetes bacterium]|nr:T9SS type A sorting domain-containing protein [Bacteroidota bacterium]
MKNIKIRYLLLMLWCIALTKVQAQQSTTAAGGDATSTGGSISYSIGQVAYIAATGGGASLSQGVQQPYEIYTLSVKDEAPYINLLLSVYPNPTTNLLTLKVENNETQNLSYRLTDLKGQVLGNRSVEESETNIPVSQFAAGIYFLTVSENQKEIKQFKIIKN